MNRDWLFYSLVSGPGLSNRTDMKWNRNMNFFRDNNSNVGFFLFWMSSGGSSKLDLVRAFEMEIENWNRWNETIVCVEFILLSFDLMCPHFKSFFGQKNKTSVENGNLSVAWRWCMLKCVIIYVFGHVAWIVGPWCDDCSSKCSSIGFA